MRINKKLLLTIISLIFVTMFTSCADSKDAASVSVPEAIETDELAEMKKEMIEAAHKLPRSSSFEHNNKTIITAMGVCTDNAPKSFEANYLFPAIESMTGVRFNIDWKREEDYTTAVATAILSSKISLPDIISPINFGEMELADDNIIIPLDDYLYLMPDIVDVIGKEGLNNWRAADGHIYSIPYVSKVKGSYSTMVRKDWLDQLGMDVPNTWESWMDYLRAVRDNDMNHNGRTDDEIPVAFASGMNGERSLIPFMNSFGMAVSSDSQFCVLDDGTYTLVYEHPRYDAFLREMAKLYQEGILVEGYEKFTPEIVDQMMNDNILGLSLSYTAAGLSSNVLRDKGVEDALWLSVKPIPGKFGNRLTPEKTTATPGWCITTAAAKRNKVEDIVKLFNWCFTEEGANLLNYGIDGISYDMIGGKPVFKKELVENGFEDIHYLGINFEAFGGYWLEDEYMQCMFSGKSVEEFTDIQTELYKGIFVVNNGFYYEMPPILETPTYISKRTQLITSGICEERNRAIRGEITIEQFWNAYNRFKQQGLEKICEEASQQYRKNASD